MSEDLDDILLPDVEILDNYTAPKPEPGYIAIGYDYIMEFIENSKCENCPPVCGISKFYSIFYCQLIMLLI